MRNGDGFVAHAFGQRIGELVAVHGNGHTALRLVSWNHSEAVGVDGSGILIGTDIGARRGKRSSAVSGEGDSYGGVIDVQTLIFDGIADDGAECAPFDSYRPVETIITDVWNGEVVGVSVRCAIYHSRFVGNFSEYFSRTSFVHCVTNCGGSQAGHSSYGGTSQCIRGDLSGSEVVA